jgi:hypothetical protein
MFTLPKEETAKNELPEEEVIVKTLEVEPAESIFLQNYGFTLRNEAIKLETLNWVINK